jgi:NTP pyrophosphatase (non-canonical NTP hydrolase)
MREEVSVEQAGKVLQEACYGGSVRGGWHNDIHTGQPNTAQQNEALFPLRIALIHSECSEALEGHRKNLQDDKLPHRKMAEVELADVVIRVFDLAGAMGYDLGPAIAEKLDYNTRRKDHTREHRTSENGKKY